MANIIADKKIMPEYIQYKAKPRAIANEACSILSNNKKQIEMQSELKKVHQKLGNQGASNKAAEYILSYEASYEIKN